MIIRWSGAFKTLSSPWRREAQRQSHQGFGCRVDGAAEG
jgi:hypothetical protein